MIIRIIDEYSLKEELCLIEFQGELEGDLAGNELGQFTVKDGTAEVVIGSHVLEGKVVTLSKPYLVTELETLEGTNSQLKVLGTASKKLLFKDRPKIRTSLS